MTRRLRLGPLLVLAAVISAAGPPAGLARGGGPAEARGNRATPDKPPAKPPSLDDLFARLKVTEDPAEAKGIARLIERRLDRSGSATADLLTDRARQAMLAQDFPLAAELMDRVTALEPTWAEGWRRRATAFLHLSDRDDARADLQRALVLEPRHFEAWAALGRLYEAAEDKARALAAFRRAQGLYPQMDKIREAVDRLAPEVDGRDL